MTRAWRWKQTGFAAVAALLLTAAPLGLASAQQTPQPPAEAPSDQPPKPKRLTGAEAWNLLVGNSATGRTSDGMRTEYYGADGVIRTLVASDLTTGKWRLQDDRVCIQYPPGEDDDEEELEGETCYRVTINGNYVVFIDANGEGWRLRIVPGNPKDL
jgi:hypothetical protein